MPPSVWSIFPEFKGALFRSPPERLIAFLRLLFSIFALLAIYVDPTQPIAYIDEVYNLIALYVIYSAFLMYVSSRINFGFALQLFIHCTDILTLSLAVLFTDGLGSPFFTFYTFTLFTATMRWGWRGAFSTAAVLAVLFVAISWEDLEFRLSKDSQSNILIMRGLYLFVAAAMLGYFGAYMDRSRRRLARLAAWPLEGTVGGFSPIGPLRHAANVLGARTVFVVWWDPLAQLQRIAYWSHNATGITEIENSAFWEGLVRENPKAQFFSPGIVAYEIWRSLDQLVSPFNQESGRGTLDAKQSSLAFAPLQSKLFQGGVFIIDPLFHSEDVVSLGEIVAMRISADLEREVLAREVAEAAMAQERVRVARDMHDSVLQDLTAASLMLKSAMTQLRGENMSSLKEVGWLLANQQRRIRTFVERTNYDAASAPQILTEKLDILLQNLERQWKCKLNRTVTPPDLQLTPSLSLEIFQLIGEAIANAARHGRAKEINIDISGSADDLRIRILDDGVGMPVNQGGAILAEPRSIKKRVTDLQGTLDLSSTTTGTELLIRIPAQ